MVYFFMNKIFFPVMFLIIVGLFLLLGGMAGVSIYESIQTSKHCARWETKVVHQESYTTYQYSPVIGRSPSFVMITHTYPARDVEKKICVEVKQ
jgi:hypothetical protein